MAIFSSLQPAEQARQLANPEGQVGIEVAEWLNGNNREGNGRALALLGVQAGHHVLEIGFGNGRAAPDVIGQAADVQYTGIDISPTMVDEANRFNAALVAADRASFHLASAERMPFDDASFDRVFSTGVIHFWKDALVPLREVHRVMRPGSLAVMGALDSRSPPQFARSEFGFHLRSAAEWVELFRQAGFGTVDAQNTESEQLTPDGTSNRRYTIRLMARR
jgi:ubiquinone/menaquinone biosynthesis C-methylase UbiE